MYQFADTIPDPTELEEQEDKARIELDEEIDETVKALEEPDEDEDDEDDEDDDEDEDVVE